MSKKGSPEKVGPLEQRNDVRRYSHSNKGDPNKI